ncbi:MAG: acyl-CoA dehydratase activase, partial [Bacteroidales bacterium]
TKMALLDNEGKLRFGIYTRTQGKPLNAFQRLLHSLTRLGREKEILLNICGLGTTGSGRKLVGTFAGADIVKNEISAHLKGAVNAYSGVRTIFEIGGQDSKFISVEDGWMKDANMNYVCAAGTGSFLEEQANNMNIPLDEISRVCKDALPPIANHRCTVFMEQDANQLLTKGMKKSQVMASILYAVCKNYLNRVVHNRPVVEPILFLGATAKNSGLVEAFRNILNKEVLTSSYSHIMGAVGMAEMCREEQKPRSLFKGMWLKDVNIQLSETTCTLCRNECVITHILDKEKKTMASWGYQCGRDPDSEKRLPSRKSDHLAEMKKILQQKQAPEKSKFQILFPQALNFFSYNSLWQYFFSALDIELKPIDADPAALSVYTNKFALTDSCFPFKLAVGRVIHAMDHDKLPVFLPAHIQDDPNPRASNSFYCPLSQAFPSVLKSSLRLNDMDTGKVLAPVVDFSKDEQWNISGLYEVLKDYFGLRKKQVAYAWTKAREGHQAVKDKLPERAKSLTALKGNPEKPAFVILGRSYNLLDDMLNLGIPKTIARYGYDVIPMDMLPVQREDIPEGYQDMYWAYGQKIVAATRYIIQNHGLYPVFLTNFNCGPDSFLLSVFESEVKDKPALILELDEHGEDGGYMTRLEAFFDRVEHHFNHKTEHLPSRSKKKSRIIRKLSGQTVYIPPMHPVGTRMASAALRAFDIDSVPLRKEDAETYAIGNACVRGGECMPAASTIGSFIYQLRKEQLQGKQNGHAVLFMPCTDGPCRFGQYVRLHEKILEVENMEATIISPNSDDHYGDITGALRKHLFKALMVADITDKLTHRIRPYVSDKDHFKGIMEKYSSRLEDAFERNKEPIPVLRSLNRELNSFKQQQIKKPLVGIVGEIYVRNSPFSNGNIVEKIEESGGEAWVVPMMEWLHYTSAFESYDGFWDMIRAKFTNTVVSYMEKKYMSVFDNLIKDRKEPPINAIRNYGIQYLPESLEGESILSVGRTIAFIEQGVDLVVNVAPFGCMPGSISASVLKDVSKKYGVPVISLFYDGETDFSQILETYIHHSVKG